MSLYLILLTLHDINRWLVLLTGVWTLARTIPGLSAGRVFTAADRRPVVMFMGTLHLQLLLGLMLFAYLGMSKLPVFPDGRASFQWEHVGLGLFAATFGTLAAVLSRRAPTNAGKFRVATTWTALALVVILLAIPWWRPLLRFFGLGA